jgi:excinuclease UvrABC helicase subunit UvrB
MSIEEEDEFRKNLVNFFKLFKDRPYHLANYLIDNFAFNKSFINKILMSDKLKSFKEQPETYFYDIAEMEDFFNSFIDVKELKTNKKNIEKITKEVNDKMNGFIEDEKFEDAAQLRDYMIKNRIKRIK